MLTDKQTRAYLDRLGISGVPDPTKDSLDLLVYAHQTHIPFETVGMRRGNGVPDVSVEALYGKVIERGNGGYCFELNKLFQELLESLGYQVRPALSRAVRGREGRMPINHRGMVVELPEGLASVDVGFGGPMPAGVLMLDDGAEQDIRGDIYITAKGDDGWWKIDRITKAGADLHDDGVPARRQTELELCTASVEDIDFDALNLMCAQPGTLFRDHDVVNLRTDDGYLGYKDGVLTVRQNGDKTVTEIPEDRISAMLKERFGLSY